MRLATWLLEILYIYGGNKAFKSNQPHAVEMEMSSKICAHAMETPTICHNYRIYHKNRICMHAPQLVDVVQWLGGVFMLSI
jgi:hypothetical protein